MAGDPTTVNLHANGGLFENNYGTYDELGPGEMGNLFPNVANLVFGGGVTSSLQLRDGYKLASWNTAADGTGTSYAIGDQIPYTQRNTYFYAIWEVDSGGGGGGSLTVTYKGSTIHTASTSGSATLNTAGKYMEGDVELEYTLEGGGGGGDVSLVYVGDSNINDYNNTVDIDISDYVDYYDIKVVFVVQPTPQYTSNGDIACAFIVLDTEPSAVLFYQNGNVNFGTNGAGAGISGTTLNLQSRWQFTPGSTVLLYGTEKQT